MKRLSYMACLLLASAAFTACDEDFKDWADTGLIPSPIPRKKL